MLWYLKMTRNANPVRIILEAYNTKDGFILWNKDKHIESQGVI